MIETFTLNNGVTIPQVGFGTWEITPDTAAREAVMSALQVGYRLIDTARIYGNEAGVGQAVRESGLAREQLFVTTKLWNDDQGYDSGLQAFEQSLERLGLDYIDLYLIHWPVTGKRFDSWKALQEIYERGDAKAIGVSNFTVEHLRQLLDQSSLVPMVNQVEFHPYIYEEQRPLLEFCRQNNILVEAYSPISRYGDAHTATIDEIAERLGKTPQQVILRWCVQHGTVPLPRSTNPDHIRSNLEIFDFELTDDDMSQLNHISDGKRVTWDPTSMK